MDSLPWILMTAVALSAAIWLGWRLGARHTRPAGESLPLEFVSEQVPVAILLFAHDGRIRYTNRAARRLLFADKDPKGQNFLRLLDGAPAPVCEALSGATDALFTLEEDGAPQTFQLLRRDVSFANAPHTWLLLNPLTREVARHEAETLKKVIRVINHELNNSLASMSSLVSSARFITGRPDKLPHLGRVLDGLEERTKHLQHFLGEYARLSRLPKPRPHKVDWPSVVDRLQQMHPRARIQEPPRCDDRLDEVQIEQALINLLKNATEAGGEMDQVELVFRENERSLEIGVLDRGSGFSQEALRQGLLPFYSTKPGGSGVGLALCREIVEGHGGSLRIKNREGGGSAVYMVLPRRDSLHQQHQSVALTLTRT